MEKKEIERIRMGWNNLSDQTKQQNQIIKDMGGLLDHIEQLEARCRKMEEGIRRLHDHPALQVKLLKIGQQEHEHLIVDSYVLYELKGMLEE